QLEPVGQLPVRDQPVHGGGQAGPGDQPAQAPEPAGFEAEYHDVPVGAQDAVDLTDDRMRAIAELQRVRQDHGIDGIARNRQQVELAVDVGALAADDI